MILRSYYYVLLLIFFLISLFFYFKIVSVDIYEIENKAIVLLPNDHYYGVVVDLSDAVTLEVSDNILKLPRGRSFLPHTLFNEGSFKLIPLGNFSDSIFMSVDVVGFSPLDVKVHEGFDWLVADKSFYFDDASFRMSRKRDELLNVISDRVAFHVVDYDYPDFMYCSDELLVSNSNESDFIINDRHILSSDFLNSGIYNNFECKNGLIIEDGLFFISGNFFEFDESFSKPIMLSEDSLFSFFIFSFESILLLFFICSLPLIVIYYES